MAIQITTRPAEFCPHNCPFMDLEINIIKLHGDFEVVETVSKVSCVHERVCSMWAVKKEPLSRTKSLNDIRAEYNLPPIHSNEIKSIPDDCATWMVVGGWRIRRNISATCSNCGYAHPPVKVTDKADIGKGFKEYCPECRRHMILVKEI